MHFLSFCYRLRSIYYKRVYYNCTHIVPIVSTFIYTIFASLFFRQFFFFFFFLQFNFLSRFSARTYRCKMFHWISHFYQ